VRRQVGGPWPLTEMPATRGGPMRPLLWVFKSHDKLALALTQCDCTL
jgi:hypothetical protein